MDARAAKKPTRSLGFKDRVFERRLQPSGSLPASTIPFHWNEGHEATSVSSHFESRKRFVDRTGGARWPPPVKVMSAPWSWLLRIPIENRLCVHAGVEVQGPEHFYGVFGDGVFVHSDVPKPMVSSMASMTSAGGMAGGLRFLAGGHNNTRDYDRRACPRLIPSWE